MHDLFVEVAKWLDPFFIIYFAFIYFVYALLLAQGARSILRREKEIEMEDFIPILRSNTLPSITFIIPAYNESERVVHVLENVINLSYRHKKIIVVNDGSTDNTLELLKEQFQLVSIPKLYDEILPSKSVRGVYQSRSYTEITLIDKENGTKYDAMNAGLNACRDSYFICLDADTFVDDVEFNELIRPLLDASETIAVGASIRIMNGATLNFNRISTEKFSQNFVLSMETIEYLRTFIMRQGWNYMGGNFCLSGAFAIFKKDAVLKAGGYGPTIANDLELTLRLHRFFKGKNAIIYVPNPVAWTEGPTTMKALKKQRIGWQRGTLESIWFHKKMLFNPKYKGFGFFSFPFLVFAEALEPVVELMAYLYIVIGIFVGVLNPWFILLLLCITYGMVFLFTLLSILIEELSFRKYTSTWSLVRIIMFSTLENFGFRQMSVFWRLLGCKSFFERFSEIQRDSKKLNQAIEKGVKNM